MIKKNEQFYKLLSKTRINNLIYDICKKRYISNAEDVSPIPRKSIELLRKDVKSSSIVSRADDWCYTEYDLDIIIPVYNTGVMFDMCIKSVLEQNANYSYKIIIINDGSTDKLTITTLDKYSHNDNIIVINTDNQGLQAARNCGLDLSKGKYIMFLDSDDILKPDAISCLMEAAIKNDACIVEGAYTNISMKNSVIKSFPHKVGMLNNEDMYGYVWGKVFKRELFLNLQFPNYYFEDSIVKMILYKIAKKKIGISEEVYGYRRNRSSISFSLQKSSKSLDSYWINKQLGVDLEVLGIKPDQDYYEYLLRMSRLSFRRNIRLPDIYLVDLFDRICCDMERYKEFATKDRDLQDLEQAIRTKNYKLFYLFNTMKMF